MQKKGTDATSLVIIAIVILASTFLLWIPFLARFNFAGYVSLNSKLSMFDLYRHWDGPLYVIVAKSFYSAKNAILQSSPIGLSLGYFTAHLPLYPLFIRLFSFFLSYLQAMIVVPIIFTFLYAVVFLRFLLENKLSRRPFILVLVSLFLLPRFFVVRSVGAPETMFLFFILLSQYFFFKKQYFYAGIAGGLSFLTKSPGILLTAGYALFFIERFIKNRKFYWSWLWILIIPGFMIGLFIFYYIQTGDFFAYFHSGDNIHLLFPPFQVFNSTARWIGDAWLEDVYIYYALYLLALIFSFSNKRIRPLWYFSLVFFLAVISVQHKDIARYSLPMMPLLLIVFEKFLTSKKFIIALLILLPALYFYSWNFLIYNTAPITDWSPFL